MRQLAFDGQVAVITGSGKGLGKEHALALAKRDAKIVVNNRRHPEDGNWGPADQTVEEIRQFGGEVHANYEDVTSNGAADRIVQPALGAYSRVLIF